MAGAPIHLYLHWPLAKARPFTTEGPLLEPGAAAEARLVAAFERALRRQAPVVVGHSLASVLIGGGEPARARLGTIAALIEAARALAPPVDPEITLEAGPEARDCLERLRDAGVNRLALRLADPGRAGEAALAASVFERLAVDVRIGGRGQAHDAIARGLEALVERAAEHVTLYMADDAAEPKAAYESAAARLEALGLPAYEVLSFARPGRESRHLLGIWRGEDHLGIGPGAVGRLSRDGSRLALRQIGPPSTWLAAIEAGGDAMAEMRALDARERLEELLQGLRLRAGIPRARFRAELGVEPEAGLPEEPLRGLVRAGRLVLDRHGLRATRLGLGDAEALASELLVGRVALGKRAGHA